MYFWPVIYGKNNPSEPRGIVQFGVTGISGSNDNMTDSSCNVVFAGYDSEISILTNTVFSNDASFSYFNSYHSGDVIFGGEDSVCNVAFVNDVTFDAQLVLSEDYQNPPNDESQLGYITTASALIEQNDDYNYFIEFSTLTNSSFITIAQIQLPLYGTWSLNACFTVLPSNDIDAGDPFNYITYISTGFCANPESPESLYQYGDGVVSNGASQKLGYYSETFNQMNYTVSQTNNWIYQPGTNQYLESQLDVNNDNLFTVYYSVYVEYTPNNEEDEYPKPYADLKISAVRIA